MVKAKKLEQENSQLNVRRLLGELEKLGSLPAADGASLEDQAVRSIVERAVFDASGHLEISPQSKRSSIESRVTIGMDVEELGKALKAVPKEERANFLFEVISQFTKGFVQTPHPTEMLSDKAIAAEERLLKALEGEAGQSLFKEGLSLNRLSAGKRKEITSAIKDLRDAMEPLAKGLTIDQEMRRSVIFSEKMYDAIPLVVSKILAAAGIDSPELEAADFKKFSGMVQPLTWSPGDRDSKPDMTVAELENGMKLNRRAMMKQYTKDLLMVAENQTGARLSLENAEQKELLDLATRMMWTSYQSRGDKHKEKTFSEYLDYNLENDPLFKDNKDALRKHVGAMRSYAEGPAKDSLKEISSKEELTEALLSIRENGAFPVKSQEGSPLADLDALIMKAGNFGTTALRSQIRQNRDVHEKVFERVTKLIEREGMTGKEALSLLQNQEEKTWYQTVIKTQIDQMSADAALQTRESADKAGRMEDFYFYQTLKGMQFAGENPQFVQTYLIAECDNAEDIYKATALMQLMAPDASKGLSPIEVAPLVEHPDQLMEVNGRIPYVEMMKEVLTNPQFREYQERVTQAQYGKLIGNVTMRDGKAVRVPLTAADVIAASNPEYMYLKEKSVENPEITAAIQCMVAGSDATKTGGISASALADNVMHRLAEELAPLGVRAIQYKGTGGGVHRSQPTSFDLETVQGRSMRQMSENMATKITALLARFVRNILVSDPTQEKEVGYAQSEGATFLRQMPTEHRESLAQMNLGNIANLPQNPSLWREATREAAEDATRSYMQFATDDNPDFKQYLAHSADVFAKLTSYAARPTKRVKAGADINEVFPPVVEMKGLRAIGYGVDMNASGSCASLYYGLGTLAEKIFSNNGASANEMDHDPSVKKGETYLEKVVKAYRYEPKMQDMVNRATYGVVMADMEVAWRYLGLEKAPERNALQKMINSPEATDLGKARKALAEVTLEHERVTEAMIKIHAGLRNVEPQGETPREKLLSLLPEALSAQLEASYETVKSSRMAMAELFYKFQQNNENPAYPEKELDASLPENVRKVIREVSDKKPSRTDSEGHKTEHYEQIIYPAMAAVMEVFEHAPRAYTSPNWALGQELAQQKSGQSAA